MFQEPLAERLRPKNLDEYISQDHLVGNNGMLRQVLSSGLIPSMILWGPPGTGKTTLAQIISEQSKRPFYSLSAINSGVKDVIEVIDKAKNSSGLFAHKNPILFIDEIHRFSKSQQDSLLGAVEKGWITLIGATTENPSFEVIPALLSRCQVYVLNSFSKDDLIKILNRALQTDEFLSKRKIEIKEYEALLLLSGGDGRRLLNVLELLVNSSTQENLTIDNDFVKSKLQSKSLRFDKGGEQHYDIVSAFIKSIRGSDPNAAVYWLARMIEGGEDLKFIARRLVILASEDIGNANPNALLLANNTFSAVNLVGFPESRIILSQCATYLASSPKSNAAYMAINEAQRVVKQTGDLEVPLHLRNAPSKLMRDLNYGKNYLYPHDFGGGFVGQEYLPDEIVGMKLYDPKDNPAENKLRSYLKNIWTNKYGY